MSGKELSESKIDELTYIPHKATPITVRCGDQALHYLVDTFGNDENATDIPIDKDMFDVCCVCMNDGQIPELQLQTNDVNIIVYVSNGWFWRIGAADSQNGRSYCLRQ